MKHIILSLGALLLLLKPVPGIAEKITIVGTGSGPSILKEIGKAFSKKHPQITIIVPHSIGSSGGIKAVGNDEFLIGRVARKIKDKEQHYNLTYTPIARLPIVFYTHQSVGIKNLTDEQINGIYNGTIFNWQQVGKHNNRIRVIRRPDGDSSLSVLKKSFPNFKDITFTPFAKMTYSDPDTIDLTEKTADAIAFGAYGDVMNRRLTLLKINSISPRDPAYPYYAPFALVYKEKNRTGVLKEFINFATSPEAAAAIKKGGGLPAL